MKIIECFAGAGGWSVGLEKAGFVTAAFVEHDKHCQTTLEKNWPGVPIFGDITNEQTIADIINFSIENEIKGIVGSPPCQPFSIAGGKKSTKDERDLWPYFMRIIAQVRPAFVLFENVANFTSLAFTRSKIDLENQGYAVQPFIIPACAVGALHRRDRFWCYAKTVANGNGQGLDGRNT